MGGMAQETMRARAYDVLFAVSLDPDPGREITMARQRPGAQGIPGDQAREAAHRQCLRDGGGQAKRWSIPATTDSAGGPSHPMTSTRPRSHGLTSPAWARLPGAASRSGNHRQAARRLPSVKAKAPGRTPRLSSSAAFRRRGRADLGPAPDRPACRARLPATSAGGRRLVRWCQGPESRVHAGWRRWRPGLTAARSGQ